MDAAALLKSQGWRGKGFSLHPTNNSIGLAKPLLLSKNTDGRGVGQKPHYTSDQWWLNAFDEKLKGLNTTKTGAVVQSVTEGKLDALANCGGNGKYTGASGLYASFVRGETMEGTLTPETTSAEETDATPATSGSEDRDGVPGLRRPMKGAVIKSKKEQRARRAAKNARKEEKAARKAAKKEARQAERVGETKEERRKRRAERRIRKEEKRKRRAKANGASVG
jgi:nucleolar protein TMA23